MKGGGMIAGTIVIEDTSISFDADTDSGNTRITISNASGEETAVIPHDDATAIIAVALSTGYGIEKFEKRAYEVMENLFPPSLHCLP